MTDNHNKKIRFAAVAGQFYPAVASELKNTVMSLVGSGKVDLADKKVEGIMVPHAGYEYSGSIAAQAYRLLRDRKVSTVLMLCNSHTSYFDGVVIDASDFWETPLGRIEVDDDLREKLLGFGQIYKNSDSEQREDHTLEVQMPFLQSVLRPGFKVLPISIGGLLRGQHKKIAQDLIKIMDDGCLFLVSTDLSHYPSSSQARRIDLGTLEFIRAGDVEKLKEHIKSITEENVDGEQTLLCGVDAVKIGLIMGNLGLFAETIILGYANSGDSRIGDKDKVVGYGALAFLSAGQNAENDRRKLSGKEKAELKDIAIKTIELYVKEGKIFKPTTETIRLKEFEGAFVTLRIKHELRGCIGQIVSPAKPLYLVVRDMAIAAASDDPRFLPLAEDELAELDLEISVLSKPEKIDDWREIELGRDGVIVKKGFCSGVFLPQVADETGWDREEFLRQLCSQKAGLEPDSYKNDPKLEISVFNAQVF